MCQCIDEDAAVLHQHRQKAVLTKPMKGTSRFSKTNKLKLELISPTNTEVTTPGSSFYTPSSTIRATTQNHDGPLSLTSLLPSTSVATSNHDNNNSNCRPSKFLFDNICDSDSCMSDDDALSDEDESIDACIEQLDNRNRSRQKSFPERTTASTTKDPKSVILNPPLIAPPPGEVQQLLNDAETFQQVHSKTCSVKHDMLQHFKALKAEVVKRESNEKQNKRELKLKDRKQDVEGYCALFSDYRNMQELHEAAVRENGSFGLNNSSSWFVNFREESKIRPHSKTDPGQEDDNQTLPSKLSLLSEGTLETQRNLFAEKRKHRKERFLARRRKQVEENGIFLVAAQNQKQEKEEAHDCTLEESKDFEANFKAFMIDSHIQNVAHQEPCTHEVCPLPMEGVTNESPKLALDSTFDYGPIKTDKFAFADSSKGRTSPITEIQFSTNDKPKDDTSGITMLDFERDFLLHRGRRRKKRESFQDEKGSLGSTSLISRGEIPTSPEENDSPKPSLQCEVVTLQNISLGERILNLERKMGMADHSLNQAIKQTEIERTQVSGKLSNHNYHSVAGSATAAETAESPIPDCQSPPTIILPTPATNLEPTKLEIIFEQSSDVRERIVLGNASKCQKQTETNIEFMSEDHAMVKVTKHPFEGSAFVVDQAGNERGLFLSAPTQDPNNSVASTSFANDITDQIHNIVSKYRNDGIVDAHALYQAGSQVVDNDSFDQAKGKLFSA